MGAISFTKFSGAGNDFVLIDDKINPNIELSKDKIQRICDRRMGVGADGLILISDQPGYSFEMKYFNADGSTGMLCGNGARCALKYGLLSGRIIGEHARFKSNEIEYSGEVLPDGNVKIYLQQPKRIKTKFKIKAAGQLITASFADTGSPHVVINISDVLKNTAVPNSSYRDIDELPVYDMGKEIRYSPDFAPEGTNVNFILAEEDFIKVRTYERGVENETYASGTGSVASAVTAYINYNIKPPIKLKVKSGDTIIVDFKIVDKNISDLSLTGPAVVVFKGEFSI